MLFEEIRQIRSTTKELRNFGLLVGSVMVLIGGALIWKGREGYDWFLIAGSSLIVCGFAFPTILRPLHRPWIALSLVLGWVMTRIILSIMFFLVIFPLGITARALGKRPLKTQWKDPSQKTWWLLREDHKDTLHHYKRQF